VQTRPTQPLWTILGIERLDAELSVDEDVLEMDLGRYSERFASMTSHVRMMAKMDKERPRITLAIATLPHLFASKWSVQFGWGDR
jgi:hypothetical protein